MSRPPVLSLVHDADTAEDERLIGCQRHPVFWLPTAGLQHGGTMLGIRWACNLCGLEGEGVFGPARKLSETADEALVLFINAPVTLATCRGLNEPIYGWPAEEG